MNAALIGSVSSSEHALRGLLRGGVEVTCVAGLDERHSAGVSDYRSLRGLAASGGLAYLSFAKVSEERVSKFLGSHRPDLLFVIGLSQMVPGKVRSLARVDSVGFHPTALPRGRGRAPVAWTILLGEPAAANLFFLTDEPDAGDLIEQWPVEVLPDDYAQDLIDRTNGALEQMVVDLSPRIIRGDLPRRRQDDSKATYYAKRTPADGLITWSQSAEAVYRLIRAVSHPYPGAFTFSRGRKLLAWRARRPESGGGEKPGTILSADGSGLLVQTGGGRIRLTEMEWASTGEAVQVDHFEVGEVLGRSDEAGRGR